MLSSTILCSQLAQKLIADVAESNQKLQELLAVNEMLDSHCRTLESEKHELELQLEAAVDSSSESEHDACKVCWWWSSAVIQFIVI